CARDESNYLARFAVW
nr:immunoglobulin heavy chain junction region [Macaca mulatta]